MSFTTERGEYLYKQLIKIVPGNQVDPHLLLRAYLTVKLPKEKNRTSLSEYLIESVMEDDNAEIRHSIEAYSLEDYLSYVASFEVTDLKTFLRFLKDKNQIITETDLVVSLLIVKYAGLESVLISKQSVKNLYVSYLEKSKRLGIDAIRDRSGEFIRFLNCIWSYYLDPDSTRLLKFSDEKAETRIRRIVGMLYDDLRQTTEESFRICSEIQMENPRTKNEIKSILQANIQLGKFWNTSPIARKEKYVDEGILEDEAIIVNINGKLMTLLDSKLSILSEEFQIVLQKNEWYQLSCGLYIYQRRNNDLRPNYPGEVIVDELANDVERPHDVALEMSFLKHLLLQNKRHDGNRYLIVFPSPFLVHEIWERLLRHELFDVRFVMENDAIEDLTKAWTFDPKIPAADRRFLQEHMIVDYFKERIDDVVSYKAIDASRYTDVLVEDIRGLNDGAQSRQGVLNIITTIDRTCRLIVFCRDSDMHGTDALFPLTPQETVQGIFPIPSEMVGTRQKKNVWIADFKESTENSDGCLAIYNFVKSRYDDSEKVRRLFIDYCSPSKLDYEQYSRGKEPIRKSVRKAKANTPEEKKRKAPKIIAYCPEISFKYYVFRKSGNPDSVYYVAYFIDGEKEYGRATDCASKSFSEFQNWLLNEYIYKKVRVNKGARKEKDDAQYSADLYASRGETYSHWIRDVISKHYKGANISLRAFWCFHPEIKSVLRINDDEYEILKKLIHSDLGKKYLTEISGENICEFLSEAEINDIDENYIINLLSQVLALAVKEGNIIHNTLADDDGGDYSGRNVKSALARRTLPEAKFRELFHMLNPAPDGTIKPVDLSLLIRMLTGITTPEVAALKWSDFQEIRFGNMRFHYLRVSKRIVPGSDEPQNHSKATCYRLIPLGKYLGSIMEKLYLSLDGEDVDDRFILEQNNGSHVSAKMISKTFLKYFEKLGIDEIQIKVPKGNSVGFSEVLLTRSFGDLLRENLRYWALKIAGFSVDEVCALFGTSRITTAGKYYIDYNNEQSLLYLYAKLNRIESFLLYGGIRDRIEERRNESLPMTIVYNTFSPIRVDLQYESSSSGQCGSIIAKGDFGAMVTEMEPFPEEGDGK